MKKKCFIILIFVFMILNFSYTYAEYDWNDITVYCLSGATAEDFFLNPTKENMENLCFGKLNNIRYDTESKHILFDVAKEYNYNYLLLIKINDKTYSDIGIFDLFSCESFNMLEKDNINNILSKNGINSKAESVSIIDIRWGEQTYPYIIWINTTDNKNYYLTSDLNYSFIESNKWVDEVFNTNWNEIRPISQEEFNDIYLWKEGELYIDNKKIENKPKPIAFRYTQRVPIRTLLEVYGFEDIEWDKDNYALTATSLKENRKYAFLFSIYEDLDNIDEIRKYDDNVVKVQIPEYLFFRQGRFYLSPHGCVELLGFTFNDYTYDYDVDLKNRTVYLFNNK